MIALVLAKAYFQTRHILKKTRSAFGGSASLSQAECGKMYQNLDRKYGLIGGVAGLLFGASQEAVRQLKRQCDQEEAIAAQQEQSK